MTLNKMLRFFLYFFLGLMAIYYLMPLYIMLITSFKSLTEIKTGNLLAFPKEISFSSWSTAWSKACAGVHCVGLKPYFWNSIIITVPAVIISTMVGAINGYVLTKWKFKGSEIFFALILFGCFIPFQIVLLPMARTLGILGLAGTAPGLILVHVVYGICFTTLFFRNFYITVSDEIVKAALIDGANFFNIFFKILLPLSIPIIVVSCIWQFTNIWNDFLFGVSFSQGGDQPLTVALNNIVNSTTSVKEYNIDMAAAILAGLPTLLVYVVGGKYFIRGLMAGSVKG